MVYNPSFFVKEFIGALVKPLYVIFKLIIRNIKFASHWKEDKVTSIFKSVDKHNIYNYRARSVLSNSGKIIESV